MLNPSTKGFGQLLLRKIIEVTRNMILSRIKDIQANCEQVLDKVLLSGELVKITNDVGDAILVSEEIWRHMTETLKLLSILGMRETVRSYMREAIVDSTTGLDW